MNKKFIKVSISIFLLSFIFILGFKFILGNKVLYSDSNSHNFNGKNLIIKYDGFQEDKDKIKIKVKIKNNSEYYAALNNVYLTFEGGNGNDGKPIFKGYDNQIRESFSEIDAKDSDIPSSFLDPNEERDYIFQISKGLKFDKNIFDTNRMAISYNANFYKYRLNKNTVVGSAWSSGGTEFIENSKELFNYEWKAIFFHS